MGELATAFTFDGYISALARAQAMDPGALQLAQASVLGSLTAGSLVLFVVMIVRRSGTAAAGFALLILTALSQALVFGVLDFLTPSTRILIGGLTASALLLFVNAVLHTGRENMIIAGLSALIMAVLLALSGATMAGFDLAAAARLAMFGSTTVASALLVFAMVRDFAGKAFLGASILLSVLASILMTDPMVPLLSGLIPVTTPSVLIAAGVLLATLSAPFLADEMRMEGSRNAAETSGYAPASLFADDADQPASPPGNPNLFGRQPEEPAGATNLFNDHDGREAPTGPDQRQAVFQQPAEPRSETTAPHFAAAGAAAGVAGDTASNHWPQDPHAVLEAADDEYVWDALAQPEVRCGQDVLKAFDAHHATDLSLEGLRERLAPHALQEFDSEVLGGAEPVSGTFDLGLETSAARFVMRGRRQVDHDGILMRIDAELSDLAPITMQPQQIAAPTVALPRNLGAVVKLGDRSLSGLEIVADQPSDQNSWKEAVLASGELLKSMLEAGARGGFALIDASSSDMRPGVFAAAVGKAYRVHELPKGAMVVGLRAPQDKESLRDFLARSDDIRKAGGGVALMLDGPNAKPIKGFEPDMVWLSAADLPLRKRSRKPLLEGIRQRFGVPIVIRDLQDDEDARQAADEGAWFGVGRTFQDVELPSFQDPKPFAEPPASEDRPRIDPPGGAMSALRTRGLR